MSHLKMHHIQVCSLETVTIQISTEGQINYQGLDLFANSPL